MTFKIYIVDDHQVLIDGLRVILDFYKDIIIFGQCNSGEKAIQEVSELEVDLIIMDLMMPGKYDGGETTKLIKKINPDIKVLALSMMSDQESIEYMLSCGADGFIIKNVSADELAKAIKLIMKGGLYIHRQLKNQLKSMQTKIIKKERSLLSDIEKQILLHISNGLTTSEIASTIFRSTETIKSHRKNLLIKLKCKNSAEMVKVAFENNFI